ncbi:zinc finger protein 699-like [Drosophila obscura]|uniref:zinc finger protein 699-like n=1 Tax=Drosophila obscura TaxID=7282 RepID=UPI001BB2818B|nr:zinc finger protein 699-like [Drosophila obscura]
MAPEMNIGGDGDPDDALEEFKPKMERRSTGGRDTGTGTQKCGHTGNKGRACSFEGCDKSYLIVKWHLRSGGGHERSGEATQKSAKCSVMECSKTFSSGSSMQRHVREAHGIQQHTNEYPYRCSKCSRGFYLEWHRESHQSSCRLYSCPGCDLQFVKRSLFMKHCHETMHGRKRNRSRKCPRCENSYDKPSDLRLHMEAKHKRSVGPFACTEAGCSRSYSYARSLRQHRLAVHFGRRFECPAIDCGRSFSSAQNLSKHQAREHTEVEAKTKAKGKGKGKPKTKSNTKARKCRRDAGKRTKRSRLASLQLEKDGDESPAVKKVAESLVDKEAEEDEDSLQRLISAILQDE